MFSNSERDRIYEMAVTQLDTQFERARQDVLFNLAVLRHDDGARDAARWLFQLAGARLAACLTDQAAA